MTPDVHRLQKPGEQHVVRFCIFTTWAQIEIEGTGGLVFRTGDGHSASIAEARALYRALRQAGYVALPG